MQNYDHLGQVFKNLRTNRHISLKQISNERVSAAQISRFERGESDISLEKFLIALSNMHIEVSEFMDAVNNYQRTEQIRFMSALIPLEYERNIAGFQKMQAEEAWEFSEHPDIYRHHLNVILLQSFICKCDATVPFPEEYIDEVTDYLFTTEEWNMYELILIGNLYLFIDIPLLHRMGQEQKDAVVAVDSWTVENIAVPRANYTEMSYFWTAAESFGNELRDGIMTHENAAEKLKTLEESSNTSGVN